MTLTDELALDLACIESALLALDILVTEALPLTDLEGATRIYDRLQQATRDAGRIRDELANRIGEAMPEYRMLLAGRMRLRHHKTFYRDWDHDGLLRLVVDSRVRDETTGEIESTLDVVKKVYGLQGYKARRGALKALAIDVDEFCSSETRGYSLETK